METKELSSPYKLRSSSALPPATGSSTINVGASERIISIIGGIALAAHGFRNLGKPIGISFAFAGGYLLARGVTGYCAFSKIVQPNTFIRSGSAIEIDETLIVNRPREEVYNSWRKLENLPKFMRHLEDVKQISERNSVWRAKLPGVGGSVTWKAEITEDDKNNRLAWTSLPGSVIDNAGEVVFRDTGKGTEIDACITYRLPAGDVGSAVGKLVNPVVEKYMNEDLQRFKTFMETGELPVESSIDYSRR